MKRRTAVFKVSLIAIMIAILCVSLSACGLIDALKTITHADVYAIDGLESGENDVYTAYLGEEFTLGVKWYNARVTSPDIEWRMSADEGEEAVVATDQKTLSLTYERANLGKTYTIYAVVNEIKSSSIKVTPAEAPLSQPTITSSTHSIVDGKIQQNRLQKLSNVLLSVSWNEEDISQALGIQVKWYVDGVLSAENVRDFSYDAETLVTKDCNVVISVVIGYQNGEDTIAKDASVTLVFVSEYDLVSSVKVFPSEEGGKLKRVAPDTYYLTGESDADNTAEFTTSLSPDSAYQKAKCEWTLRSGDNSETLKETNRTANIQLAYGKNIVTASIGNVQSRQIIVYVMSYEFAEIPTDVKSAMTDKFVWKGNSYDKYISSQYDLNACVASAVAMHKIDTGYQMYVGRADWRNSENFVKQCSVAMKQGIDESGAFSYTVSVAGTTATLTFKSATQFGVPSGAYANPDESHQAKVHLRYREQSDKRTSLPVDDFKETVEVYNSNDLYRAVSFGYKPIFVGDGAQKLQELYSKARDVLIKYISDDMTEVEKVAAIYDWIVYSVEYDHAVANLANSSNASSYNAFYLEGVFDDNRAVCDGKSKAFALLCGMEGIRALRITGEALTNGAYGGHAWNKVLVDADDDGEREWYVVDTTWGDSAVQTSAGVWDEYLTYSYFLRTDADIASTHRSDMEQPVANTVYNTYKNTFVTVAGQKISMYVRTTAELNALLAYSKANGGMCLSVYIVESARGSENFGHLTPVRDGEYVIFASSSSSIIF